MAFLEELSKICGIEINEILTEFNINFIGGKILNISNYSKIICYSEESISLKCKNTIIDILGLNLKINEMEKNNLLISGKIFGINLRKK